jgi:hypothetical protein
LHQLDAFLRVDLSFKASLRVPAHIQFESEPLLKCSPHKEHEYKAFITSALGYLDKHGMKAPSANYVQDFYRLAGGRHLDDKARAVYVYVNHKQHFFEDTKTHSSFIRIRRDHLKRMGITRMIELDFYDVSGF